MILVSYLREGTPATKKGGQKAVQKAHTGNLAVILAVRWAFITYFVALSFHSFWFAPDVRIKYGVFV